MFFYLLGLSLTLLTSIGLLIFYVSGLYSTWRGSPFVPTENKNLVEILQKAKLKRGQVFIDLGCGEGRIVRQAVKSYQVKGVGIDVNPILIFIAKQLVRLQKLDGTSFICQNIFETDITQADIIYIFLMPKLIEKLQLKLISEAKKGTVIISHGFKIPQLQDKLYLTLPNEPFPTYYYKI